MRAKLSILSDLHLEFGVADLAQTDAEVVVLAGDVAPGLQGLQAALTRFDGRPVIYVAGNHEYYHQSVPELTDRLRSESEGSHVSFLENREVVARGIRFLGCTLWTDFDLFGPQLREISLMMAGEIMNDYRVIRSSVEPRNFRPADSRLLHLESRAWLEQALQRPFDGPTVVVTHHAPSIRSIRWYDQDDPVVAAYASNLETLMDGAKIALWIHGHTHHSVDYLVNGTRVLSNQRGYPDQRHTGFQPSLTVEL